MSFVHKKSVRIFILFLSVYLFFVSIKLMGSGFKLLGKEFAESLIAATTNPLVGLFIGILATSVIQSSSCTTSILVGMVASGILGIGNAIPIVMGANIGTTITNTIVSLGHINTSKEFKKALGGATVHDFFNIIAVMILLPLELFFHVIEKTATYFSNLFVGVGGIAFTSPLNIIVSPAVEVVELVCTNNPIIILIVALVLLFLALKSLVTNMRALVIEKIETFLDVYLFRTALTAFLVGLIFTAIVQSSSITTSLVIPLIGAGILTIRKMFPYALGANLGTTVTAFLAALAVGVPTAITIALVHFFFNLFGIAIIYPLKSIPIGIAERFGEFGAKHRKWALAYIVIGFYIIPLIFILLMR